MDHTISLTSALVGENLAFLLGTVIVAGYEKSLEMLQKNNRISRAEAIQEVDDLARILPFVAPTSQYPKLEVACQIALARNPESFRADLGHIFPSTKAEKDFLRYDKTPAAQLFRSRTPTGLFRAIEKTA